MAKDAPLQSPLRIGAAAKSESRTQFGALCFRRTKTNKAGVEVLLVSSRDTGRWIIPKGWPMDRETPAGGGGDGSLGGGRREGPGLRHCIGHISYHKWIDEELSLPVIVAVFPIEVLRVDDDFPEAGSASASGCHPRRPPAGCRSPNCGTCCRVFDARLRRPDALDHRRHTA
jgi:hypothetical protein